jgi:hypothetical protein
MIACVVVLVLYKHSSVSTSLKVETKVKYFQDLQPFQSYGYQT